MDNPPIKGQALDVFFRIRKTDNTVITAPANLAARVMVDGRGFDCATPSIVDTTSGTCKCSLTPTQTNGTVLTFTATSTTVDAVPFEREIKTAAQTFDGMMSKLRRNRWRWS